MSESLRNPEQLTPEVLEEMKRLEVLQNESCDVSCETDGCPHVDGVYRLRDLMQKHGRAIIAAAEREREWRKRWHIEQAVTAKQQERIAELEAAMKSALLITENEGRNKNLLIREGEGDDLLRWANELRDEAGLQALKGGAK